MTTKGCKGTGNAQGSGCGHERVIHRYGLCLFCFKDWLMSTENGKKYLKKTQIQAKKKSCMEARKIAKRAKESIKNKSYFEKKLQTEINTIVRLIDIDKGCISCEHGWSGISTRQFHAGHRLSVGSNPTLRYNLYNIYRQCSICNNYLSGNERAFDKGIVRIYGQHTLDMVKMLPHLYKILNLSVGELKETINTAREIKKDIIKGKDYTRAEINEKLGIYAVYNREKWISMDNL